VGGGPAGEYALDSAYGADVGGRNFGFAVAQAYAGHEDHGRGGRAMATYVRAGLPEVAMALAALLESLIRWRSVRHSQRILIPSPIKAGSG
jgi:hypothetical protein